jgi:alanine racemase
VAGRLLREGARRFFVARISEGEALRRSLGGRTAEILVFDGCPPGAMGRLLKADLTPVLNSQEELALWGGAGRACVLHVDTGMNRLGLRPEEAHALAAAKDRPRIRLLLSHLACAGVKDHPLNARQLALFHGVAAGFPEAERSLCNTEALALGPAFRFDLARPGVGLHGFGPAPFAARLQTAARLTAPVLQVRTVQAGESVGYGAGFQAERPLRVAIVAAGYADGVLRASGSGGYGWHDGRARPILGLVSMDLLALDVSDGSEPRVGDRVELLGPPVPLAAVAAAAATPYEVLAHAARRVRPAQAL